MSVLASRVPTDFGRVRGRRRRKEQKGDHAIARTRAPRVSLVAADLRRLGLAAAAEAAAADAVQDHHDEGHERAQEARRDKREEGVEEAVDADAGRLERGYGKVNLFKLRLYRRKRRGVGSGGLQRVDGGLALRQGRLDLRNLLLARLVDRGKGSGGGRAGGDANPANDNVEDDAQQAEDDQQGDGALVTATGLFLVSAELRGTTSFNARSSVAGKCIKIM